MFGVLTSVTIDVIVITDREKRGTGDRYMTTLLTITYTITPFILLVASQVIGARIRNYKKSHRVSITSYGQEVDSFWL